MPQPGGALWSIVGVRFAHQQDWPLNLRLERGGAAAEMIFEQVVGFRAEDESEILDYWQQRSDEGVSVGTIYEIADSAYLTEFARGTAGITGAAIKHYLIAGHDLCVEVLATAAPRISIS